MLRDILEKKENKLSYNKKECMNNNYPSWKHYKYNGGIYRRSLCIQR